MRISFSNAPTCSVSSSEACASNCPVIFEITNLSVVSGVVRCEEVHACSTTDDGRLTTDRSANLAPMLQTSAQFLGERTELADVAKRNDLDAGVSDDRAGSEPSGDGASVAAEEGCAPARG